MPALCVHLLLCIQERTLVSVLICVCMLLLLHMPVMCVRLHLPDCVLWLHSRAPQQQVNGGKE